jgi:hypothetical protein
MFSNGRATPPTEARKRFSKPAGDGFSSDERQWQSLSDVASSCDALARPQRMNAPSSSSGAPLICGPPPLSGSLDEPDYFDPEFPDSGGA